MAHARSSRAMSLKSRRLMPLPRLPRRPHCRPPPPITAMLPFLIPAYLLLALTLTLPAPTITNNNARGLAAGAKAPLLARNFPDPCIIQDPGDGMWYAFATGSWMDGGDGDGDGDGEGGDGGDERWKNIQAASAPDPRGPWTYLPQADPLPDPGGWSLAGDAPQIWAPSVVRITTTSSSSSPSTSSSTSSPSSSATSSSDSYILYYAAQIAGNSSSYHCIGAATSPTVLGPYTPLPQPIVCPLDQGGAIDPAGFVDPASGNGNNNGTEKENGEGEGEGKSNGGRRYLLYKIDGNAKGNGGDCGNGVEPLQKTPLMLQEVDRGDGVTLVGVPVEVLDRDIGGVDGPLVEAPDLAFYSSPGSGEGRYVLLYSNHCWTGPGYSVNYAVAGDVRGPYQRGGDGALIRTGDRFNITAPGGASSVPGGGWLLFHGNCPEGRCLFGTDMEVDGGRVTVR